MRRAPPSGTGRSAPAENLLPWGLTVIFQGPEMIYNVYFYLCHGILGLEITGPGIYPVMAWNVPSGDGNIPVGAAEQRQPTKSCYSIPWELKCILGMELEA